MSLHSINPKTLIHDLDGYFHGLNNGDTPRWLSDLRQDALKKFTTLSFPTVKDEEWKYTNIAPIVNRSYKLPERITTFKEKDSLNHYCDKKDITLVFLNGQFSKELSTLKELPNGLTITTLPEAMKDHESELKDLMINHSTKNETTFVCLNKAMTKEGTYIKIEDNVRIEPLIHIVHVSTPNKEEITSFLRTLITLGKSAQGSVIESYVAFSDEGIYFTNALTNIFLAQNASLQYCKAQKESLKGFHLGATEVLIERDASFKGFSLTAGGAISRNNLDIVLNGQGSSAILDGLYSIYGTQLADNHTSVDHRMPNATSNQLYKGILNGSSRAVFNGKIFVRPIAQQTNAYQLNKNLLLGRDCRIDTKPQLEINADDVKCTHGATIGQLNEDEIFYMQSRSINRKNAIKMLSRGFIDDLINTIGNKEIQRKLNLLLEPSFAQL